MSRFFSLSMVPIWLSVITLLPSEPPFFSKNTPDEIVSEIIEHAYVSYDDPIEFTYLASVSKRWYALIKISSFINKCKRKGFAEPVMMFFELPVNKQKDPNLFKQDIVPIQPDKNITLYYIDPQNMHIDPMQKGLFFDPMQKGLFWNATASYVAVWVNPSKIEVYNAKLLKTSDFVNSKIMLTHYISCDEKAKQLEQNNGRYRTIAKDCITAEPFYWNEADGKNIVFHYDKPVTEVPSPIPAERLVRTWPASYIFRAFKIYTETSLHNMNRRNWYTWEM